jgi:hypothetical protein
MRRFFPARPALTISILLPNFASFPPLRRPDRAVCVAVERGSSSNNKHPQPLFSIIRRFLHFFGFVYILQTLAWHVAEYHPKNFDHSSIIDLHFVGMAQRLSHMQCLVSLFRRKLVQNSLSTKCFPKLGLVHFSQSSKFCLLHS